MSQRTGVHPLRVYYWNETLQATTVHLCGFRARHRDGYYGPPRATIKAARADLADHERERRGLAVE